MVRSTLRAVESRLTRQGESLIAAHEKLPNFAQATVPPAKVFSYVLNPEHPRGKHKARVFSSVLGFTTENGDLLIKAMVDGLKGSKAEMLEQTPYGTTYRVDMEVTGPRGTAMVRTGWILDPQTGIPRLTSAFVK